MGSEMCIRDSQRAEELRSRGIEHVVVAGESLGRLSTHDVEDLVTALRFGAWRAVGKRVTRWAPGEPHVRVAALTSDLNDRVVLYDAAAYAEVVAGGVPDLADDQVFAWQVVKDMAPTTSAPAVKKSAQVESSKTSLSVLLAGHDLKFIPQISAAIQQAGHRVLVDRWGGHDIHDEAQSLRLLEEADVIFCEWALGNVKWFSHNKRSDQRLVVRVHAQELRKKFLAEADLDAVDAFVFVSPVGMRRAQILFGVPASRSRVIGNTFDFDRFSSYRPTIDPHTLGLVGSVPESKRLDLALDVVEGLASVDEAYRLVVKGKEYSEYPWLMSREKERAYFEAQYARLSASDVLQRAVSFGGHSEDIAEWYRTEPGFIPVSYTHLRAHETDS